MSEDTWSLDSAPWRIGTQPRRTGGLGWQVVTGDATCAWVASFKRREDAEAFLASSRAPRAPDEAAGAEEVVAQPWRCPICCGAGYVAGMGTASTAPCPTCDGQRIVWGPPAAAREGRRA